MAICTNLHQINVNGILNRIISDLSEKYIEDNVSILNEIRWTSITKKCSTWSRGKLFCIEGNKMFLVPTNLPAVSYLNLEEFAFKIPRNYVHLHQECIARIVYDRSMANNPLVDDLEGKRLHYHFVGYRLMFREVATGIRQWTYFSMQHERQVVLLELLTNQWDKEKYMKLLRTSLDSRKTPMNVCGTSRCRAQQRHCEIICRLFFRALFVSCEDSDFTVEAIAYLSLYCLRYCFLINLFDCIFLLLHFQRANLTDCLLEGMVPKDILYLAFKDFDLSSVKLSLELEFSSGYFNPIWCIVDGIREYSFLNYNALCVEPSRWPREKDGLQRESFNSIELCAAFSHVTLWVATYYYIKELDSKIHQCFQLLWRAIPTPYLPIKDMQVASNFDRILTSPLFTDRTIEEHTFWETVTKLFGDDPPTEYKPRSLKHLCRYAARRRVRSPEDISSLDLPERSKQYLLLEL